MEAPDWLREFSSRHAARIEPAVGKPPADSEAPTDLAIVAEHVTAFRFDDFVTITFRAFADEGPLPETFPTAEILCHDDSGNLILCDYRASAETATIIYLSHDPLGFVIVAESMREFLGQIALESGVSYRPLSRRYEKMLETAMDRFDPDTHWGPQTFAKTGDGMPLFVSVDAPRVEGPAITLNVPR